MKIRVFALAIAFCLLGINSLWAVDLSVSIGIRETGGTGPAFSDAGAAGGIEWVNRDGQSLTLDGTWQQFIFTPSQDTLLAFAGATANSVLDVDWASLEHIRLLNSDGITDPIRLWFDDVSNTDSAGTVTEGFEAFSVGEEVLFQEPGFSGSTTSNVAAGSISAVSDTMAFAGDQSYQADWQFVDNDSTRWVRLTTFANPGTLTLQNAAMHVRESAFNPTISFWAKGLVVPEPGTAALASLAGLGLLAFRRRS